MPQINQDHYIIKNAVAAEKDLLSGKNVLQITDNDDEDILKNDVSKDDEQRKLIIVSELKKDMEDEDDLDEEAETIGVL